VTKIKDSSRAGLTRRRFMAAATATAGAFGIHPSPTAAMSDTDTIIAPARETPIVRRVDVLVCGGGPAGVGAALFAARTGAKTMLIESMPFLGGVWTAVACRI